MPSIDRTALCAPSAAITHLPRMIVSLAFARSTTVAVTPSLSWVSPVNSWRKRSSAMPADRAASRRTGSSLSWAQPAPVVGLSACSRSPAPPYGRRLVSGAARVGAQTTSVALSSTEAASRTADSSPQSRNNSSVLTLRPRAFGCTEVPGWRSISRDLTPCRDRSSDADRPTGPPPTIRTGTSASNIYAPQMEVVYSVHLPTSPFQPCDVRLPSLLTSRCNVKLS